MEGKSKPRSFKALPGVTIALLICLPLLSMVAKPVPPVAALRLAAAAGPDTTLFGAVVPGNPSINDSQSVELGVVLTSRVAGEVAGIRFYKGSGNSGSHVGRLWSRDGTPLASVVFSAESPGGWQTALFSKPVTVSAGQTFVASYLAPAGHYAEDPGFFASPHSSGPLTASGSVYRYGSGGVFPRDSYNRANYWVDVLFRQEAVATSTQTLFGDASPSLAAHQDTAAVELGIKVKAVTAGRVTGMRFYKGDADNVGPHFGSLWSSSGQLLRRVAYTNESASGWQEASVEPALAVLPGDVLTASYSAPSGQYTASLDAFTQAKQVGAFSLGIGAGVFRYGASAFPSTTYRNTNYWVDLVFEPEVAQSPSASASPSPSPSVSAAPVASASPPAPLSGAALNLPRIPWEGGPQYWKKFANADAGGWDDPTFFPILAWWGGFSSNAEVQYDKSIGVNTYVQMYPGTPFQLFEDNDVYWIGDKLNDSFKEDSPSWPGHFLDDEVDGRFTPEEGRAHLQSLVDSYADDGKFKYANYTSMVVSTDMAARDAEQFVNSFTDAVSLDMYFYTIPFCDWTPFRNFYLTPIQQSNCKTSSSYGKSMDSLRLRDAADGKLQPLWQFIENVSGSPGEGPSVFISPGQVKGAVMNSIINEARGIVYFNQIVSGSCQSGNVFRSAQYDSQFCGAQQVAAVKEVNNQVHSLASIINTQSYQYSFGTGLDTMLKSDGQYAYVFAMVDGSTPAGRRTFTLPPGVTGRTAEVLFENRTVSVDGGGQFSDGFAQEHTYHIYRIRL